MKNEYSFLRFAKDYVNVNNLLSVDESSNNLNIKYRLIPRVIIVN